MKQPQLTEYDRDFLLGKWEGTMGAAYNQVYEFCRENGLCDRQGKITPLGQKVLDNPA